ncbi:MAG: glycosyltransferase family 2 protein, partial [Nanoarchaeota archaeon]
NTNINTNTNSPKIKIVKHERNKNVGAALRTGFSQAEGDLVAALDSDCTYDPTLIFTLAEMIDEQTDIATVSPYHPQGQVSNVPRYRIFLSKSASLLYRLLLHGHLYTYTALVRVYKKEVIQNVSFERDNFLGVTEILVKALLQGYRVRELPAELQQRKFGTSKMKMLPLKVIKDHLSLMGMILKQRVLS